MKVILYMAISADGKTTGINDDVSWVSESDVARMDDLTTKCGVMVMGSKTYESFGNDLPNSKSLMVVLTKRKELLGKTMDNVIFTDQEPKHVLSMLKQKGFKKIMLAGGQEINTSFLTDNLIDELWLIRKPLILGEGKSLFTKSFNLKLKKIENRDLENNTQEVKYKVK